MGWPGLGREPPTINRNSVHSGEKLPGKQREGIFDPVGSILRAASAQVADSMIINSSNPHYDIDSIFQNVLRRVFDFMDVV